MPSEIKQKGFTLIELVIAMAIMAILFATAFFSYQQNRITAKLEAAQREVGSAIKQAQSYALQGRTQDMSDGYKAPAEYGFQFRQDSRYRVFYVDSDGVDRTDGQIIDLPGGVTLSDYSGYDSGGVGEIREETRITFDVPHGNYMPGETKTFVFSLGDESRSITINKGGKITED